jgi:hypothetical protein
MEKHNAGSKDGDMGGRRYSLTLGLPTVIGGLVVLCAGFVFVFVLGVLLGRGYDIEGRIPALQAILPTKAEPVPPVLTAADAPRPAEKTAASTAKSSGDKSAAGKSAAGEGPDAPAPDRATGESGVLGQGELAYRTSLRAPAPDQADMRDKDEKKTLEDARRKAQDEKKKAEDARRRAQDAPSGTGPDLVAAAVRELQPRQETRYHYVYQAAAYKEQGPADRYTEKLRREGVGARTEKSMEKGVAWYRVMIDFTGAPDETDSLREGMRARGVPKILLKSKLPVE